MSIRIVDLVPRQGCVRPGGTARYLCTTRNDGESAWVAMGVELLDLDARVHLVASDVQIPTGDGEIEIAVRAPDVDARGYRVVVRIGRRGGIEEFAESALLVVSHWRLAPRYGFLSDFGPDDAVGDRVRLLARFHLTVVQFYDWMYRHHTFLPPESTFEDAMGRTLSLDRVRELLRGCHEHGMAALAYGAVYGAEPDYANAHPEQMLYDAQGRRHALIDLFTINDVRPGSAWRDRILEEYERTVSELDFDGIHMDQYGTPKRAFDHAGRVVDLATQFPGLIDEAAKRLAARKPGASVLFNAVNDWPVDDVAGRDQAAVYIEVWRPHIRYRHLVDLVRRARDLSGKQVILAAYLEPFRDPGRGAEAAARLVTAVIASAGGHHLLLGEGNGVLRDPYYPNHGRLSEAGVATMRRYYDHTAALHRYLYGPDVVDVSRAYVGGENAELALEGAPSSPEPAAGTVWVHVARCADHIWVLNLVNLLDLTDDRWNAPKPEPVPKTGLRLRLGSWVRVRAAVWSSPDGPPGIVVLEPSIQDDGTWIVELPALATWATLVIRGYAD